MNETLEALLQEGRTFAPSKEFQKDALITEDGLRIYRTEMDFPVLLSAKELMAAG